VTWIVTVDFSSEQDIPVYTVSQSGNSAHMPVTPQTESLSVVCRMIERVRGRTGLPFNTLETGSWLSFDSRINFLGPMTDHFFLSAGSAITNFVRLS